MESQIPLTADRLETSAYRQQLTLRGQEGEDQVVRTMPLIVPGGKSIGVVTIREDFATGLFNDSRERDLQLGGFLHQAARALQTVGTRRQELALAGRVQASLLPTTPPAFPGWDFAAAWRPARETAGDFYDFIPLTSSRLGIVIGDVVDKGMGPALLMALTRTLVRTYAADFPDNPEYVVQIANERILTDLRSGLFVTLFYGILNIRSGEIIYCNAGHNPPFLQTDNGMPDPEILTRTGMAIGITEGQSWDRRSVTISPGGTLFLYTDGVIDAQNSSGKFFGEQHLLDFCQSQN
jgi:sigma-B regulation protein RsbU (phosphoserine phosphatase)